MARSTFLLAFAAVVLCSVPAESKEASGTPFMPVYDVVLGEGGLLLGHLLDTDPDSQRRHLQAVVLSGATGPGTAASTGRDGRFGFRGVVPGVYRLTTEDGRTSCLCRAWNRGAAPLNASSVLVWDTRATAVRGQIPMPFTNLRNTAAIGAVVGGAIAAPIIYNNARMQNRIPASP